MSWNTIKEKWESRASEDEVHAAAGREDANNKYIKLPQFPPEINTSERCLELGCGYGRVLIPMNNQSNNLDSVGIDISEAMVQKAKVNIEDDAVCPSRLSAIVGTVDQLPFDNGEFDLVFTTATLLHLPKEMVVAAIDESLRVLRNGGVFYAMNSFPNQYHLWTPVTTIYQQYFLNHPGHIRRYGPREVRKLFTEFGEVSVWMGHQKLLPGPKSDLPISVPDTITELNSRYNEYRGRKTRLVPWDILTGRYINVRAVKQDSA